MISWVCGYYGYENKLGFCRCNQSISDVTDHFMQLFSHKSVAIAWKKWCSMWCPHLGDSKLETSGEAKSSVGFRKASDTVMFNELIPSDIKKYENYLLQWQWSPFTQWEQYYCVTVMRKKKLFLWASYPMTDQQRFSQIILGPFLESEIQNKWICGSKHLALVLPERNYHSLCLIRLMLILF